MDDRRVEAWRALERAAQLGVQGKEHLALAVLQCAANLFTPPERPTSPETQSIEALHNWIASVVCIHCGSRPPGIGHQTTCPTLYEERR